MEHSEIRCQNCGEIINRKPGIPGPIPKYCWKVACNAQHRGKVTPQNVEINARFSYSWTKYEGKITKTDKEQEYDWFCQVCNEQYPKEMTPMLFPLDIFNKECIKVCGHCYKKSVEKHITDFHKLINYVRANWTNL